MEYQIISNHSARVLEELVSYSISEGWLPHGGIAVTVTRGDNGDGGSDFHYAQAMTRTPKPNKPSKGIQ